MSKETILILGSNGQIGTELLISLRAAYGYDNVIGSDFKQPNEPVGGHFELIDVLDSDRLREVMEKYKVTQVYHLAALLSATAEQKPKAAWKLNMEGLFNVLDLAVELKVKKIFWPSSIAVFGPNSPKYNTPQNTVMDPKTIYGISKLAGEKFCDYYFLKHGLDIRSIRYPGLISYRSAPGGGTTDYAVHIFHEALAKGKYECFLKEDTMLPMMYMDDAIRGTIELMEAPADKLSTRSGYNFSAMHFTPAELAAEIKKYIPEFVITYNPDERQKYAESWPCSIDDMIARKDWGWKHQFDMPAMVKDMLEHCRNFV